MIPIPEQNVEIVRRGVRAFIDGRLDDAKVIYHPDVEWHTAADEPDAFRPYRGLEGLAQLVETWSDIWAEGFEGAAEFGEFIDAGTHVIVPVRALLRGRASGVEVEVPETWVFTFRGAKVERVREYRTTKEALEAVGLEEQAMSEENVEVVRAMLEAFGPATDRGDWLDEFFDPEIEWHDVPTYPSAGAYFGRDALSRHAAEFEDAWADWGIEVEEIRGAEDRVVARIRYRGIGKQSGVPITGGLKNPASGAVFDLRAGRIIRVLQFVTHAEALEAVGLAEQDAHS